MFSSQVLSAYHSVMSCAAPHVPSASLSFTLAQQQCCAAMGHTRNAGELEGYASAHRVSPNLQGSTLALISLCHLNSTENSCTLTQTFTELFRKLLRSTAGRLWT